jgi:tetratricopeptide (TPR) repeat protein
MASLLLLLGTVAAFGAVKSGEEAHGPAERIPGAGRAVHEHEEWGERARNAFAIVALVEVAGWVLRRKRRRGSRLAFTASAVLGLPASFALYEAAEHGGEVVYGHAGGVGTRSGDPADVERLLIAGLYHQAMADRAAGKTEEAAALIELAARRFPDRVELALLHAESLLLDRHDPGAALAAAEKAAATTEEPRTRVRLGLLEVDALEAAGRAGEAGQKLQELAGKYPESRMIERRLQKGQ